MIQYQQTSLNEQAVPTVWNITKNQDAKVDVICSWLIEHKPLIDDLLNMQGALLIRGFSSLKTAADFERVVTSISPVLMDYIGGTSPREKVAGKIMTATNRPPDWSIPLHQEMSYTKNSPDRIAFFCVQPATSGGYSTLGDMRQITRKIDADILRLFQTHGVQLCRTLPSLKNLNQKIGLQKAWSEVFGTVDPMEVDRIAAEKEWRTEWLDQETVRLWQEIMPATKVHPVSKAEVWFNQAHGFAPICSLVQTKRDGRMEEYKKLAWAIEHKTGMLDAIFYGNGQPIEEDAVLHIEKVHYESEINVKLEKSDLLILDNTLTAHGRSPFVGHREILVALINMPDFSATPSS